MLKIAFLFGGVSEEYEVSLCSVAAIIRALPRTRYEPLCIGITQTGAWLLTPPDPDVIEADRWQAAGRPAYLLPDPTAGGILIRDGDRVRSEPVDLLFPVLHGGMGESGALQGLLALSGIPFVGCDVHACALTLDKSLAKRLVSAAGVGTADWIEVSADETDYLRQAADRAERMLGYPLFVKPRDGGSSIGAGPARDRHTLLRRLSEAATHGRAILIERQIRGRELEVAVTVQDGRPIASLPGEIRTEGFYSYEEKYAPSSRTQLCTAPVLPAGVTARIRELAVRCFTCLGCRGLARVDFFLTEDGALLFNEVNALPGFTETSMFPRLMTRNCRMGDLLELLIREAIRQ